MQGKSKRAEKKERKRARKIIENGQWQKKSPNFGLCACTGLKYCTILYLNPGKSILFNKKWLFQQNFGLLSLMAAKIAECRVKNGIFGGIFGNQRVKISWEPKYEAVILNFRFIVPRRRTRDTVQKFGKPFLSLDQF